MKIAILLYQPGPNLNPLFQLLNKQKDIDLMVYYRNDLGVKVQYDPAFGVVVNWGVPVLEGYNYKILRNFSLRPSDRFWGGINLEIITEIINNKFDAILIHGWNSFANWLAFVTAIIIGTPIFLSGESPLKQELLKSGFKQKIKKFILINLFKKISAFLYIGEENRKFYKYYGVPDEKLFSYPYAADNKRLIREADLLKLKKNELKKELGLGIKSIIIVFIGRLVPQKNPLDLLMAYEKLIVKLPKFDIRLVFVGEGVLRPALEKYAADNNLNKAAMVGFKNKVELMKYLAVSDVFVLPSGMGETWGMVVNEAMCFGLPVIVSDIVGSSSDLVKNGENGYIFQPGNIEQLTEHLKDLALDSKKRKSFSGKSLDIIKNYSYEKDVKGILGALNKIYA